MLTESPYTTSYLLIITIIIIIIIIITLNLCSTSYTPTDRWLLTKNLQLKEQKLKRKYLIKNCLAIRFCEIMNFDVLMSKDIDLLNVFASKCIC